MSWTVVRGSQVLTGERAQFVTKTRQPLGRAKVGYLDAAVVRIDQHVVAFDVSVDNLVLVLRKY